MLPWALQLEVEVMEKNNQAVRRPCPCEPQQGDAKTKMKLDEF